MSLQTRLATLISGFGADVKTMQLARDLPAYVDPYVLKNRYDPILSMYNLKPSNTRKFRAAAAKAQAGLAPLEIVVVGASFQAGALSATTWNRPKSPPMALRNELARRGIPISGSGYTRFVDSGATALDPHSVFTGANWNANSKWYVFTSGNGQFVTITLNQVGDVPGDKFKLTYLDLGDGSTFTVSHNGAVSGAGFATVTNNNAGKRSVTLSVAVKPGDTIVVTKTSAGGNMTLMGWQVYNSAVPGVIVHNLAQSGSQVTGIGVNNWVDVSANTSLGNLINDPTVITSTGTQPALVLFDFGTNDIKTGVDAAVADVLTGLTTMRGWFSSSDAMFVFASQVIDSLISETEWEAFGKSLYEYVEAGDYPLFDVRAILGTYTTVVANGQSTDGIGHLLAEVSELMGRTLGTALGMQFGNVETPKIRVVPTGTTGFASEPDGTIWIEYTP